MFYYLIALLFAYYCYNRWVYYRKFYSQGLNGPRPWPIFGNSFHFIFKPFARYEASNFKKYGDTYVDYILNNEGVIVTSNPDYVKRILVKDFHRFSHRLQPTYMQPFARKAVIFQNEDWKRIRTQVTPVFSSGRLKLMFNNFKIPVQTTLNNIDEMVKSNQNEFIDIKKLMKAFSLDMIGNVVFSLKTNSLREDDDFRQRVTDLFAVRKLLILILFIMPKSLIRLLKITFLKETTVQYFAQLTLRLIEERKKHKDQVYNDFIELLLKSEAEGEVEKNYEEDGHIVRKLTTEEIVGQCFIFFVAGLETVSTALSLLLYELAINQDIQDKLYKDLITCYPNDELTYDEITKSKYLDAVVNETLRKHTTLNRINRKALTDYDFGEFKVQKGQTIGISLYNLHNDERLYKEPFKFKPERFIDGELADSTAFQPIPFVDGPRNCIGNRFALIEMKSLLIPLLKQFRVYATSKTDIPLKPTKGVILNMIENVTLGIERRKN